MTCLVMWMSCIYDLQIHHCQCARFHALPSMIVAVVALIDDELVVALVDAVIGAS